MVLGRIVKNRKTTENPHELTDATLSPKCALSLRIILVDHLATFITFDIV